MSLRANHFDPKVVVETPHRSLSARIVITTALYSLLIAIIVSTVQIVIIYQQHIALAQERFRQIETGYLPSLTAAIWEVTDARVDALLDSIAQLPDVGKIVLTDDVQHQVIRNGNSEDPFAQKTMTLRYTENNRTFDLGALHVELTNTAIMSALKKRAIGTASITLLTLCIGFFVVLILFQRLVSRHLYTMAEFAKHFDVTKLGDTLQLKRSHKATRDELDLVVMAINTMQSTLKTELELRADVEQELRAHKDNLEFTVKARTQELKSTVDQLDIAADVAELGIWSWSIADNNLQWNARMLSIYEHPSEQVAQGLESHHWFDRIHPDDAPIAAASLKAVIKGKGELIPMFRIITPSGQIRYVQARAHVERDAQGKATKVTGINRDITSQMEMETRLIDAKERADVASAAKSSFLANMSHEIRTPMNAVLGMLQLTQQTDLSVRQKDYVTKAQTAAKSLLGLLNDILDFSKIDAGKLHLDHHPFDLEPLMSDLGVILSANQAGKNIEVMFDIDTSLPKAFISDRLRLQQILINLAGNALKFTTQGYVLISVTALVQSTDEVRVRIAVSDTGIGISQEQQARIFDSFVQAEDSTARRFGGTGLGLVISKRLVALLGGELHIKSEVGQGSRFWFDVNLKVAPAIVVTESKELGAMSALRILVVDDNAISREIFTRTLAALGSHVDSVKNGQAAIERVAHAAHQSQPYDVVLMDLYMPEMDGLYAAEQIGQIFSGQPPRLQESSGVSQLAPAVIMVTAFGRDVVAEQQYAGKPPYAEFLTKPLTPQQIMNAILTVVGKSDASQVQSEVAPLVQPSSIGPLGGLNILVVEDNELNRQVAFELLVSVGARVTLAEGGLEGVAKVLDNQAAFDVVIMDVQMPDIDGLEATRRIRADKRFAQLPILAMTANASAADRDECLAAGMNDHIGKPIDITLLVARILSLVPTAHAETISAANWVSDTAPAVTQEITPGRVDANKESLVEPLEQVLKRFSGKVDFYERMLAEFPKKAAVYIEKLKQCMNVADAAKILHSIKGLASTMGAKQLATTASELEQRCKTEFELGDILSYPLIDSIQLLCEQCVSQLVLQLAVYNNTLNATVPVDTTEIDGVDWKQDLAELLPLLEVNNMKAMNVMERLYSKASPELKTQLHKLQSQIDTLDFGVALATAKQLLRQD